MSRRSLPPWAELSDVFRRNVHGYPALMDGLAGELGVSVPSLIRLHAGLAPLVEFRNKKKERYHNGPWWTFPERDARGNITGVRLRRADGSGTKLVIPGSKPGLFYPLADSIDVGVTGETPGFERVAELGIDCPVCGKPDWCMIAGDAGDPNACICGRVSDGAAREVRDGQGWLHILKPSSGLHGSPLPASGQPVFVVEGASDAAAALDLGVIGVGRPNDRGGLNELADLLSGRDVVVVGENDRKADGSWPGKRGMENTAQTLISAARSVRTVLPPEDVKDLRQWVSVHRPTSADVIAAAQDTADRSILPSIDPAILCDRWIDDCHHDGSNILLRRRKGIFYRYEADQGCYKSVDPNEYVNKTVRDWIDGKRVRVEQKDGVVLNPIHSTRYTVGEIAAATERRCPVPPKKAIPFWLDDTEEDRPSPSNLIIFKNGVLDVDAYCRGEVVLMPPTPNLFTTVALPYNFRPDAKGATLYTYLNSALRDEPEKQMLAQEWCGYNMVASYKYHKFMYLIGRPRSGKGTLLSIIEALVGADQCAATSYDDLGGDFGLAPLRDTLAALIGDAHDAPAGGKGVRALQSIKSITGHDLVSVNKKKHDHEAKDRLMCRFTIASNQIPNFPDAVSALNSRYLILHFKHSFEGREDHDLRDKLQSEVEAIAVWALEGYKRLHQNGGHFTQPPDAERLKGLFRSHASTVAGFAEERCDIGPGRQIARQPLYDAYVKWAHQSGTGGVRKLYQFGLDLLNYNQSIEMIGGVYHGISLKSS